jgi:hypothetical protein
VKRFQDRKDYIKLEDTKVGYLYKIHGRNARFGIFCGSDFMILRTKWEDTYLSHEIHMDLGGTAFGIKELEQSPWDKFFDGIKINVPEILKWLREKTEQYKEE